MIPNWILKVAGETIQEIEEVYEAEGRLSGEGDDEELSVWRGDKMLWGPEGLSKEDTKTDFDDL